MAIGGYLAIATAMALGLLAVWRYQGPSKRNIRMADQMIAENREAVDIPWCLRCGRRKGDPRMWLCHGCNGGRGR